MAVVTERGLSSAQAARRLAEVGPNALPTTRPETWPRALARQLTDTVVVVLLVAAALTIAMGDLTDASVIFIVIVLNSLLSAGQEVRSSNALAALADLTAPQATAIRDGRPCSVPAAEVVPGDVIVLSAGDIVAADGVVLDAESLQLDESLLSGESLPIDRSPGAEVTGATVVTRGHGNVLVQRTGSATAIGAVGRGLQNAGVVLTPLQRRLAKLGRWLAVAVALVAVVVAALNIAAGHSVDYSIALAISLAVAAIPESLPAVVSLSLAIAAHRMAAAGVLVRRLAAVEALGSVTVLATDKTGTLTEGRMAVVGTWVPAGVDERRLLEAAVLCNDAGLSGERNRRDDPSETALLAAARDAAIDVAAVRASHPRVGEEPFDAERARMVTTHRVAGGALLRVCKGSPEAVGALAPLDDAGAVELARCTAEGCRVLAFATAVGGSQWESIGFVALADRPRPEAAGLVAAFRAAGVAPVMITGDHPATAQAIARSVGLGDGEVYARTRPTQKSDIVAALQHRGELVAMTGDGVNDAPALRAADVGVAMGGRGTEVAKQAADLVLTKDDLSAMVTAIGEGRRAYDNLRRFLHYALSGGFAEILVMLIGPFLGFSIPLQPGQILWVNLLTHGVPGVAMGNETAELDVLSRPPRSPSAGLVDRSVTKRVLTLGAAITVCCFAAAAFARHVDRPWQSYLFLTLAFAQLLVALTLRPVWRAANMNWFLLAAVLGNLLLAILVVTWSPLGELLRTARLNPSDIGWCLAAAAPAALVAYVQTHWRRS